MAPPKKITGYVKLQIVAAKATPAPRSTRARSGAGQHHGVLQAVQRAHAEQEMEGLVIPVVITVYADRSFSFVTKTPPAAVLLKRQPASPRAPARRQGKIGR